MISPLENENITGLSLMGKIKKYKDVKVYLRLDIDKKEPGYGFDWYPEPGNALYAVPDESDVCTNWYKKNTGGVVLKQAIVYLRKPYIETFNKYLAEIYLGHETKNDDRDTAISTSKTVVETGVGILDTFAGVCLTALDLTFGLIGISEIKELTTQLKPYVNNKFVDMIKIIMYGNPYGLVREYDMDAEVSIEVSEYSTPNRLEGEKYHWGNFEAIYYSQDKENINMGKTDDFIKHEIIGEMNN